jgi:hypothetical protein
LGLAQRHNATTPPLVFESGKPVTAASLFAIAEILATPPANPPANALEQLGQSMGIALKGGSYELRNILTAVAGKQGKQAINELGSYLQSSLGVSVLGTGDALQNLRPHIQLEAVKVGIIKPPTGL